MKPIKLYGIKLRNRRSGEGVQPEEARVSMKKDTRICIDLPVWLVEELGREARRRGISRQVMIDRFFHDHLHGGCG